MSAARQLCTFYLGGHFFGVDVEKVQEILHTQTVTPVPLCPPAILGLINLRGQIVTGFNLRLALGLHEATDSVNAVNVVVRSAVGTVSLLVDEIGDVIEVTDDDFESTPKTLQGVPREVIEGAYKLDDDLLLVLDVERALQEQG